MESSAVHRALRWAEEAYHACDVCALDCRVDRHAGEHGRCGLGAEARVYKEYLHLGEERELCPSHAIYLSGCNMRCAFCSDHGPVHAPLAHGRAMTPEELSTRIAQRRREGAINVNFVGGLPDVNVLFILKTLALCPADGRLALRSPRRELVARWPRQLLRLHALAAWGYAGLAKLNGPWLRGETLRDLHGAGLVDGPMVDAAAAALGWSGLAWGVALVELGLPVVLAIPRTRLIGVALAVLFHLGIETSVMVSTFGATMLVLTVSFLPFGSSAWDSPETEGDFTPRLENGPRADDGPMEDPTRSAD